jgi:hypothetical protein
MLRHQPVFRLGSPKQKVWHDGYLGRGKAIKHSLVLKQETSSSVSGWLMVSDGI